MVNRCGPRVSVLAKLTLVLLGRPTLTRVVFWPPRVMVRQGRRASIWPQLPTVLGRLCRLRWAAFWPKKVTILLGVTAGLRNCRTRARIIEGRSAPSPVLILVTGISRAGRVPRSITVQALLGLVLELSL